MGGRGLPAAAHHRPVKACLLAGINGRRPQSRPARSAGPAAPAGRPAARVTGADGYRLARYALAPVPLAKPGLPAVAIGSFSRGSFGLTPYFFAGKIRLRGGTGGFATLTSAMSSTSPVQLGADIATPTKHGADDFRRLWIMDTNSLARCE